MKHLYNPAALQEAGGEQGQEKDEQERREELAFPCLVPANDEQSA